MAAVAGQTFKKVKSDLINTNKGQEEAMLAKYLVYNNFYRRKFQGLGNNGYSMYIGPSASILLTLPVITTSSA